VVDQQGFNGSLRELALFAGAGGGILGGKLLGWKTVCAVEIDPYCASVLVARQNDGFLPAFPIWDDVRTFDGKPWRGIVDVVSGGFPCQDISIAGNGAGLAGEKSRLWFEFQRIIGEVRPVYVFVENSPMLTLRGLDRVLGGLASLGYDAEWGVLGADDAGAPHHRKRIWILAYSMLERLSWGSSQIKKTAMETASSTFLFQHWPPGPGAQSDIPRIVDGISGRLDRIKAIGNGQVPQCMALAWNILSERIEKQREIWNKNQKKQS
jgi:DNA (cytosine-5)-methyltransferase 1